MNTRAIAAAFDAIVMVGLAYQLTGGSFATRAELLIWGSAVAAVIAAVAVLLNVAVGLAWMGLGYIVYAGIMLRAPTAQLLLFALALAYVPLLPRPRGSLVIGLALAAVAAAIAFAAVRLL